MTEPSRPTAAVGRWAIATAVTAVLTVILVAVYITMLLGSIQTTWLVPRIMQVTIYLLAIAGGAVASRYLAEQTRAHIDRRVHEAEGRMDRRMDAIAKTIGTKLDENTGEIGRVRTDVELDGYAKGYADGLARAPITGIAKVAHINPR